MISTPRLSLRVVSSAKRQKITCLCSIAAIALSLGSLAHAQTTAAATDEAVVLDEFVVSGVRASMIRAQEIKMNSLQVMDSIVAEDIGKLPDNTVADALQRVIGHCADPPVMLLSGSGAFLATQILESDPTLSSLHAMRLDQLFEARVSRSACAFAVARLAAERVGMG